MCLGSPPRAGWQQSRITKDNDDGHNKPRKDREHCYKHSNSVRILVY